MWSADEFHHLQLASAGLEEADLKGCSSAPGPTTSCVCWLGCAVGREANAMEDPAAARSRVAGGLSKAGDRSSPALAARPRSDFEARICDAWRAIGSRLWMAVRKQGCHAKEMSTRAHYQRGSRRDAVFEAQRDVKTRIRHSGMTQGGAVLSVEKGWRRFAVGPRRRCGSWLSKSLARYWLGKNYFDSWTTKTHL